MIVYIVRHGVAVDLGEKGVTRDSERMLTADGAAETQMVGRALAVLTDDETPSQIFTSPLVRARQTADILARYWADNLTAKVTDFLLPGQPAEKIVSWLAGIKEKAVALVGHMPDLGILTSVLISGLPNGQIAYKKAAVAKIVLSDGVVAGAGRLRWLITPAIARACLDRQSKA